MFFILGSVVILLLSSCNKILDTELPINSMLTEKVFSSDQQAYFALNGMYSYLIHGGAEEAVTRSDNMAKNIFSAGAATLVAGHSADELYHPSLSGDYSYYREASNTITGATSNNTDKLWKSCYKAIQYANSILAGVNRPEAKGMTEAGKNDISGQARAIRAFSYFYLVNFFGEVPLVLTDDFQQTLGLKKATKIEVYSLIETDLMIAEQLLSEEFTGTNTERIMVNKWFVKALLARVYLFTNKYDKAYQYADEVIKKNTYFKLEADLNDVFKIHSREVIFHIKKNNQNNAVTPEGMLIRNSYVTPELYNSFETGDKRKAAWIVYEPGFDGYAAGYKMTKYKLFGNVTRRNEPYTEYYVVMRLAEQVLIRAEAAILLNEQNKKEAIDDINALRERADIDLLPDNLSKEAIITAIADERRRELCVEWGHRWLDLKRTDKTAAVLGQISYKMPWNDFQQLYPIPQNDLKWNANLKQNDKY